MNCEYDALALDYHWLVGDTILSGESFVAHHRSLIDSLSPNASILDCACGIGSDAIGLAVRGFQVTASDRSAAIVAEAERRAKGMVANVQFATCQWEDLPGRFDDRFDLVLCVGNSISHTPNKFATVRALSAMRAVLKPNGKLLLATRNWEKLRRENVRASVANTVLERDGMQCISVYLWDHQANWDAQHSVELLLIFEHDGHVTSRCYALTYRPIRYEELCACMEEVGFAIHRDSYRRDTDWYEIEGRRRD
jgi:glycine/sarcosine N-methyltransferase